MKKNRSVHEIKIILEEYRRSNLSGAAFCRQRQILLQTFYSWLRKEKSIKKEDKLNFVSLSVEVPSQKIIPIRKEKSEKIILKTKNGTSIKIPLTISTIWLSSLLKDLA